jgi:hypothetical protein
MRCTTKKLTTLDSVRDFEIERNQMKKILGGIEAEATGGSNEVVSTKTNNCSDQQVTHYDDKCNVTTRCTNYYNCKHEA